MNIDFKLPQDTFLSEYRYKKPYLFKQAVNLPDKETIWRGINEMYQRANPADDLFKFRKGTLIPKEHYVESFNDVGRIRYRFNKAAVYEYLKDGATLIYNRINNEPFADDIARQIARFTQAHTIVSGYLAFGKDASYKNHWDTRDVFAVQLIGKKHWSLSAPNFDMPLYMQQSKDLPHIPEPETVDMQVVLEAGDILYIPRGWWHNPLPMSGETFHLAVGTFPPNDYNYMEWLMKKIPEIQSIRQNFTGWEHDKENLNHAAGEIAKMMGSHDFYQSFMQEFLGNQRADSAFNMDIFGDADNRQTLSGTCRIKLNSNDCSTISQGYVIANGIKINLDENSLKVLQPLVGKSAVLLSELLAPLDDEEKEAIKKLVWQLGELDTVEIMIQA